MKREIKFRAWDEGKKVMHCEFQFIRSGDEGNDWIIFISDKFPLTKHETNPFTNPNPYFAQQLKVMQYTGLKDKNGKEIYEGDIVRCYDKSGEKVYDREVDFFGFREEIWSEEIDGKTKVEIIGNIYENPNLLK